MTPKEGMDAAFEVFWMSVGKAIAPNVAGWSIEERNQRLMRRGYDAGYRDGFLAARQHLTERLVQFKPEH